MKFSLIIPCYNEAKNIPLLLERCRDIVDRKNIEVILVDNGSTDNTITVLKKMLPDFPGCRSVQVEKNNGYGFGILKGLEAAKGDVLGWTHADMQTDPQDALKGFEFFMRSQSDFFVKGKRYGRPLGDVLFTRGMSFFETILLGKRVCDINAQPTIFSRNFYETWDKAPYDFSLDLYVYYLACKEGLEIHRFPVFFGKRSHGVSHWNINWVAKWKFIYRTVNFSFQLRQLMKK